MSGNPPEARVAMASMRGLAGSPTRQLTTCCVAGYTVGGERHWYAFRHALLIRVEHGRACVAVGRHRHDVGPGDALLLPPGVLAAFTAEPDAVVVAEAWSATVEHATLVTATPALPLRSIFQRVVRCAKARERVLRGDRPAEVAYTCGFADQSHLNREFRKLLDRTPGSLWKQGHAHVQHP